MNHSVTQSDPVPRERYEKGQEVDPARSPTLLRQRTDLPMGRAVLRVMEATWRVARVVLA